MTAKMSRHLQVPCRTGAMHLQLAQTLLCGVGYDVVRVMRGCRLPHAERGYPGWCCPWLARRRARWQAQDGSYPPCWRAPSIAAPPTSSTCCRKRKKKARACRASRCAAQRCLPDHHTGAGVLPRVRARARLPGLARCAKAHAARKCALMDSRCLSGYTATSVGLVRSTQAHVCCRFLRRASHTSSSPLALTLCHRTPPSSRAFLPNSASASCTRGGCLSRG